MPTSSMLAFSRSNMETRSGSSEARSAVSRRFPSLHKRSIRPFDPGMAKYLLANGASNRTEAGTTSLSNAWAHQSNGLSSCGVCGLSIHSLTAFVTSPAKSPAAGPTAALPARRPARSSILLMPARRN